MSSRSTARVIFLTAAFTVAFVIALIATYAFGALFAHDRYWVGTIGRTAENEARLISGMLSTAESRAAFPRGPSELAQVFRSVDGLLLVELRRGATETYSNRELRYATGATLVEIQFEDSTPLDTTDDHTLIVRNYAPPTWSRQFRRWLIQPWRWLEPSFNVITAPFTAFFLIVLVGALAFGWRARAGHLEREVLVHLRAGDGK